MMDRGTHQKNNKDRNDNKNKQNRQTKSQNESNLDKGRQRHVRTTARKQ